MGWIDQALRNGAGALCAPCAACGTARAAPFCDTCRAASLVGETAWISAVANAPLFFAGAYHARRRGSTAPLSPLGRALRSFKDHGDRFAGRCLGRLLAALCAPALEHVERVVPVPSDGLRTRERGLSPAPWLSIALARATGARVLHDALRRRPGHPPQRGLGGTARRINARDAFELGPSRLTGYRVVLVDDVVTTGATLTAALGLLEAAGVAEVACCVVACADEDVIARCRSTTENAGRRNTGTHRR